MRTIHTALTLVLGLALIVLGMLGRKTQRELQQELHTITDANSVLRETLGNLTLAITDKDKQIDRLLGSSCPAPEESRPDVRPVPRSLQPDRAKPSNTGSIGAN
jgi:hypothetical protein